MNSLILNLYPLVWGLIFLSWSIYNLFILNTSSNLGFKIISILGVLLILIGVHKVKNRKSNPPINFKNIAFTILTITYILFEVAFNLGVYYEDDNFEILTPDSGFGYFNQPCAEYDSFRGYKWLKGEHRMFKYTDNYIIYDNKFKPNNVRYYYRNDFEFKKQGAKKRWILLGDSFIASEYLSTSVADFMDSVAVKKDMNIEFYPFALCGIGIRNWNRIFFNEITPNYEFDGVIINIFANDLRRSFFAMHHTDTMGYTGYLNEVPKDKNELFSKYQDLLQPYAPYMSDVNMDKIVEQSKKQIKKKNFVFNFYLLSGFFKIPVFINIYLERKKFKSDFFISKNKNFDYKAYEKEYGTEGKIKLKEIVQYCQNNKIPVIVVQIPYNTNLQYMNDGYVLKDVLYVQHLCKQMNVPYYNGENSFRNKTKVLDQYFFNSDTHWNLKGVKIFTNDFLDYFNKTLYKGN